MILFIYNKLFSAKLLISGVLSEYLSLGVNFIYRGILITKAKRISV
jgi:hypothetical protein